MSRAMLAGILALLISANAVQAAEDPAGTWTWTTSLANNQSFETTLVLTLKGDKLSGKISMANQQMTIDNAKFKDDELTFSVMVDRGGRKFANKYSGKVSGDTIKGKRVLEGGGQNRTEDWEASRAK